MSSIKNTKEIERIMRNALIENSGVNENYIRNILTEFSVDLDKDYTTSIFTSLSEEDAAILFELTPDENEAAMSEDIYNSNNIAYYKYFKLKLIVYGDDSSIVSLRVASRLRSESVRDDLISKGIQVVKISEPSEINEIINGVIWQRCDLNIMLGCELIIEPVKENYEINEYSTLNIYKD